MFTDADGKRRPIARTGGKAVALLQAVLGHGGVHGPRRATRLLRGRLQPEGDRTASRGNCGTARPARSTSEIAAAWEKYDIRLVLERNWKTLGPKLAGKIHVYMGEEDTFYLEGATRLLKESLANLKSDAVVELFPKKNHGNLVDAALRKRINEEMAAAARKLEKAERP